jgi:hypothetical protein
MHPMTAGSEYKKENKSASNPNEGPNTGLFKADNFIFFAKKSKV